MTPETADWVRANAWTDAVHDEARHPGTILDADCLCTSATAAVCPGRNHTACADSPITIAAPETVLIGPAGWVYDQTVPTAPDRAPVTVWLADRVCRQRCACPCHAQIAEQQVLMGVNR